MSIERNDVLNAAHLARLAIDDSEIEDFTQDLTNIISLADQMRSVNTEGIEPMAHPMDASQRLRADIVTEINHREDFQKIAPATENGLYLVPRVID